MSLWFLPCFEICVRPCARLHGRLVPCRTAPFGIAVVRRCWIRFCWPVLSPELVAAFGRQLGQRLLARREDFLRLLFQGKAAPRRLVRPEEPSEASSPSEPPRRSVALDGTELEQAQCSNQRQGWNECYVLCLPAFRGLRKRTPSPPPSSSMKSIPATSSALRRAASFAKVTGISPSTTSALRMVATPTFEARAKSRAVHRISARAARI